LPALVAAVGGLHIVRRFAGEQPETVSPDGHDNAESGPVQGLAIGAIAKLDFIRVDVRLEGDMPAVAPAIDFHGNLPRRTDPPPAMAGGGFP
jgi:hypothetical protein